MPEVGNPLAYQTPETEVAAKVWVLQGQGNALAVETEAGVILVDSGAGGSRTDAMISSLRERTRAPIHAICYSHGHLGYNAGVPQWLAHAEERGDPTPRLVAHQNLIRRYRRYRETAPLQQRLAEIQFRMPPGSIDAELAITDPTETFSDSLTLSPREGAPGRKVELLWAPSETDDALALWLPDERLLYGGAAVIASIPNVGTPLRTLRDTVRWAETLERLADLEPAIVIREFGPAIEPAEEAQRILRATAEALRWLRAAVVARMNRGMNVTEILHDLEYPPALFDQPWMAPVYGCPDYIVREIYRFENGWWDRNPTSLHPASQDAAASAIVSALADRPAVLGRARELAAQGQHQLALHVIDLLALAPGDDPDVAEARKLKAEWLRVRASEVSSFVSRSLYLSSSRLIEKNRGGVVGIR